MAKKELVSRYGLFTTIAVTIVGVGIFSYPSQISKDIGTDSWIMTIAIGFISYLLLYLVYKVVQLNNYHDFFQILEDNLGRVIGSIVAVFFAFYLIFYLALGLRVFSEVLKMYLLEKTPTEFILTAMILVCLYGIRGEITTLIKFNQVAFWLMVIPFLVVILFSLRKADFTNLLPIFNNKPANYFNALKFSAYSFSGFEIAYLLLPLIKSEKNIPKVISGSMIFITFLYTLVTVFSLAIFTDVHTCKLLWPTITMIRGSQIPGSFVERWEGVIMALWVIFYFTTFSNAFYFSSDILKNVFKLGDIKVSSIIGVPFLYYIAMYPENVPQLYDISNKYTYIISTFTLVVMPLILLFLTKSRKRRKA